MCLYTQKHIYIHIVLISCGYQNKLLQTVWLKTRDINSSTLILEARKKFYIKVLAGRTVPPLEALDSRFYFLALPASCGCQLSFACGFITLIQGWGTFSPRAIYGP